MTTRRSTKRRKPVWDRPSPRKGGTTHLDAEHLVKAKNRARKAGRRYPNMIDNIREAADQKKRSR